MGVITWIVLGLIAGVLAKMLMPGRDPGGYIITIFLGIAGAFCAGWIGGLLGLNIPAGEFSVMGIVAATLGATGLLAVYRVLR